MSTVRTTDTAALALEYGDRLVLGTVRDVHRAVARRAFAPTRSLGGRVPEAVHDATAAAVYAGLTRGLRGAGALARGLGARGVGRPLEKSGGGRQVLAGLNSFVGSELAEAGDAHAIEMALRHEARDVALDPEALVRTYPRATGHLVLFVHGLGESDESWQRDAERVGGTYATRVAAETGATPVLLRYNTGLHVSDNGARLSRLLADLVDRWPVRVERLTVVGHSMGGLVVRAATSHGVASEAGWTDLVRDVVCLGTPHLGAALEKAVHVGGRALATFPESTPFARVLQHRSPGIVDLRHGYVTRADWEGQDLTARWGMDRLSVAPLPGADYHFVAATLGSTPSHPLSVLAGDLLVGFGSATGRGGRGRPVVDGARVSHVGGADHLALLNHPRVAGWLVRWVRGDVACAPSANTSG